MVDVLVKAMTECGLRECELFSPQIEPQRAGEADAEEKARAELRAWRVETPLDHFRDIEKTFRAAGLSIYAYNYFVRRQLHGRGDRSRLRDGARARRGDHHRLDHAARGQAGGAVRGEAQDGRGHARPLERDRSRRVRDAGELRRRHEDVEVLQGQPGHRPFHRRELRRRGLPPRAPCGHHEPAREGPQEEPGRQHAVGRGRHADSRGPAAHEANKWPIPADIEYEYKGTGTRRWTRSSGATSSCARPWPSRLSSSSAL